MCVHFRFWRVECFLEEEQVVCGVGEWCVEAGEESDDVIFVPAFVAADMGDPVLLVFL